MTNKTVKLKGSLGYEGLELSPSDIYVVKLTDGYYHKADREAVCRIGGSYYRTSSPLVVKAHDLHHRAYGEGHILKENASQYEGGYVLSRDLVDASMFDEDSNVVVKKVYFSELEKMMCSNVLFQDEAGERYFKSIYFENRAEVDKNCIQDGVDLTLIHKSCTFVVEAKKIMLDGFIGALIPKDAPFMFDLLKVIKSLKLIKKTVMTACIDSLVEDSGEFFTKRSYLLERDNQMFYESRLDKIFNMTKEETDDFISKVFEFKNVLRVNGANTMNKFRDGLRNAEYSSSVHFKGEELFESKLLKCYTNFDVDKAIQKSSYEPFIRTIEEQKYIDNLSVISEQPTPKILAKSFGNQGGNFLFFESKNRSIERSPTLRQTNGIGYTFGVEIETASGILPASLVEHNGLKAVGDRSISSLEYVTSPLHGDVGINKLMEMTEDIGNFCTVDHKCGIHVHVGGSNITDSPKFNRMFSVYAIKLGLMLQDELFSLVPTHRLENRNRDGLQYCGKIDKMFGSISRDNWRELLGMYVYGEEFSSDRNSKSRLFRWIPSRYKWLNLVNCNSDNGGRSDAGTNSRFQTIEFRIFDGSLNKEDVRNFVLISLAFTKFVDCHQRFIDRGDVSLYKVLTKTLGPIIGSEVSDWVERRKELKTKKSL